jgi:hypothetical protein
MADRALLIEQSLPILDHLLFLRKRSITGRPEQCHQSHSGKYFRDRPQLMAGRKSISQIFDHDRSPHKQPGQAKLGPWGRRAGRLGGSEDS